jgi:hypothetical protein
LILNSLNTGIPATNMRCVFVRSNSGERLAILLSTSQDNASIQLLDLNGEDTESLRCKGILLCKVSKTIVDVPIRSILRDVLVLKKSIFDQYICHQLGTEVFAILDVDISPKYSSLLTPVWFQSNHIPCYLQQGIFVCIHICISIFLYACTFIYL